MPLTPDQEALKQRMLADAVNHPEALAELGMTVEEAAEIAASA